MSELKHEGEEFFLRQRKLKWHEGIKCEVCYGIAEKIMCLENNFRGMQEARKGRLGTYSK